MKIRYRNKTGNFSKWQDVDSTKTFLPEYPEVFEISEEITKIDAMVLLPGLFASLRADYKEYKAKFDELSAKIDDARIKKDKELEKKLLTELKVVQNIMAGKKAAKIEEIIA